jgi:type VI secretion system secreted protein Hcp
MAGGKFLLTMTGTKQGKIKGSSTKKEGDLDYSQGMECHGFNYNVMAPHGSQSGVASGRRRHQPVTITKEVDSASPKLWQALCSNETFKSARLQFAKPGSGGKSLPFRTIELINGAIVDIRQAPSSTGKRCEYVTLAYEDLLVNDIPHGAIPHFS